ncbi:hypothetical protein Tco_1404539 [Tanacetum coccineum]
MVVVRWCGGSCGGDDDGDCGVTMMMTMVASVWWWQRVAASGGGDRVDRVMGSILGFGRKSFPVAVGWWPAAVAAGKIREREE